MLAGWPAFSLRATKQADSACRSRAQSEFEAEQEYIATLSHLTAEDRRRHTERQAVSWMYQKPAGLDAANSKVEGQAASGAAAAPASGGAAAEAPASGPKASLTSTLLLSALQAAP